MSHCHTLGIQASVSNKGKGIVSSPAINHDPSISRKENSNLISITALDRSIWRGKIWSTIDFKVKIDDYFIETPSSNHTNANPTPPPYILKPSVIMYSHTGNSVRRECKGRAKFEFQKYYRDNAERSFATVTSDRHNSLKATLHQDLFEDGDAFSIEIEAARKGSSDIIFGRSSIIHVTNFALSIEECFHRNPHVMRVEGANKFAWFSRCGGEKSGLSVTIKLKDEKGRTVQPTDDIHLKTELIYSDGTATPNMPLSPLKERRARNASRKTLYRPLVPDPTLRPSNPSASFSFRIEEVSFHHPDKDGFKLMVLPANDNYTIHPGVLEESITVLSKPKYDHSKTKKRRGGRSGITNSGNSFETRPSKARKVSNECKTSPLGGVNMIISLNDFVDAFHIGSKCALCNAHIASSGQFLVEAAHTVKCMIRAKILPSHAISGTSVCRDHVVSTKLTCESNNFVHNGDKWQSLAQMECEGQRYESPIGFVRGPSQDDLDGILGISIAPPPFIAFPLPEPDIAAINSHAAQKGSIAKLPCTYEIKDDAGMSALDDTSIPPLSTWSAEV